MSRYMVACAIALLSASTAHSQAPQKLSVPADTTHWSLEGRAEVKAYQGRPCLFIDGGGASLNDLEMRDGVIDVDALSTEGRGFFGIQFRISSDGQNGEWVYLRPHKSGQPDAIQYTPVLNTGLNWQLYNGSGFTAAVEIPRDTWIHLRLEVTGAQAKLYVRDMATPALVIDDLKSGIEKGPVALAVLTGPTYFSNFEIRTTPDTRWERHAPAMRAGVLTDWRLSPSYDALTRNLEHPLEASEKDTMSWQEVKAEPPGLVVINRYRPSPHSRVSYQFDFSKRLDPQQGMRVVYARTNIPSTENQVKRLDIGYSDDVSVFLNGRILFRGRSSQYYRDPGFLGIMNLDNDVVYLPLKKGTNELVLAVSDLGGGWGFSCRLAEMK